MKKFLFFFVCILILSQSAFSKAWQNNLGVGLSGAFSSIGVDKSDEDDITQVGYGAEGTYIGLNDVGFTLKGNIAVGLGLSKDISLQDRKTNVGAFENVAFGAGYSFVHTETGLFGVTLMGGLEMGQYSISEKDVVIDGSYYDTTTTISLITVSAGVDVFGMYRVSQKIGFFANLEARYIIMGSKAKEYKKNPVNSSRKSNETKTVSDEANLFGKIIVQPTFGISWTF